MRLARLILSGFKSFADTTEFTFDDSITGIVGPNGCGKSNVVDAIKWVLGERSSKSLRGTEMIDVIFAGSAGRKPSGMASVTLAFENPLVAGADALATFGDVHPAPESREPAGVGEDAAQAPESEIPTALDVSVRGRRALPIDADVVEVERRLYRDGDSQYLINGRRARLKDIRDLFLDTGIGADAYSIIEQGKVDAMLLASPQERRTIFEEAAGIAKYKLRRVEAQRKLERTETNLTGTREQLASTERRLKVVKGQAARARTFVELDNELKAWRLALAFDQYDDLEQRLAGLTSRQAALAQQREESHRTLEGIEGQKQEAELSRHELATTVRQVEQEGLSARHAEQQGVQRREMLERSCEEAKRQLEVDRARSAELSAKRQQTDLSVTDHRETVGSLAEQLAGAERRMTEAGTARTEVLELLGDRRRTQAQKQAGVTQIDRERSHVLASLVAEEKRAESLREQGDNLSRKRSKLAEDERSALTNVSHGEESLARARAEAEAGEREVQLLEEQIARLGEDRRGRAETAGSLEQELVRADSRRATLAEMIHSRAGYAEAVRQVLESRDAGQGFAGVIGSLAELIRIEAGVDADAANAVEMALGIDLQGLVVESTSTVPAGEELAKLPGRVMFLPMRGVSGVTPAGVPDLGATLPGGLSIDDPRGRLVSLRSLVRTREPAGTSDSRAAKVGELLDRLLEGVYLVSNIDAAFLLASGPMVGRRCRFVTRDGLMLDADGRVFAGPLGGETAGAGFLRRGAEFEVLEVRVQEMTREVEAARAALAAVDAETAGTNARIAEARARASQQQRLALTEQGRVERLRADAARFERERKGLEQEHAGIAERLAKIDRGRLELAAKGESLLRLFEDESTALTTITTDIRNVELRAEATQEQMATAKVEVSRLTEQIASARRDLHRLESARDEMDRQGEEIAAHMDQAQARVEEHAAGVEDAVRQIAAAKELGDQLAAQLADLESQLSEANERVSSLGEKVTLARQQSNIVERDWHSLETSRRELEVKRENLEERAQQDLSINLREEYPDYRATMEGGEIAKIDPPFAAVRVDTLKEEIRKLGHVNLDAIDEERTLEKSNDDLVRAVADLDAARIQLHDLIEKLNAASKERFSDVFARIQDHFGGESGMFRKLFGGGKAEVRLMPLIKEVEQADGSFAKVETDETDLLESGIEVIAKPPGKEPRSISQLSGGEKTLTAVALLMSIFRSKPSCFCVLDEVDAALDEANVGRFNTVIREYTDRSHFIVITHNKRTMQSVDKLFGVTMQERGVSTRVAVKFEQVGHGGQIHVNAPAMAAVPETPSKARRTKRVATEPLVVETKSETLREFVGDSPVAVQPPRHAAG